MNLSMKPRRILIFSLVYYHRFVSGAELAVKEVTDRISDQEIQFDLIALNGGHEKEVERIGNTTVYRIFKKVGKFQKLFFPFVAFFRAVKLNRQNRYDAIWSIMANYAGFATLFFKITHSKIPFVLTLQEGDPFSYIKKRVGFLYPLFKMIFTHVDHIQAISNYLADWARDMGATCPIYVIPNAVDWELFSKPISNERSLELKQKLGKKSDDIFLVHTGRLTIKNALKDVVDALQFLPQNVKLILIGQGEEEDNLKKQISDLKLDERVMFAGFMDHQEMSEYLKVCDIFIRPSLSEGLGNSFLEAMASGIPVVATPVGGIPDFLIDGETGLFCEVKNPKSIVQKVEKLIKDKESREYIVGNAKKIVQSKYQWKDTATKMRGIFLEKIR